MKDKAWKKLSLYIPLILVEVYLGLTLLLYEFGPIDWQTENVIRFWTLLGVYHLAFIAGYVLCIRRIKLNRTKWDSVQIGSNIYRIVIWGIIALSVVCACIEYRNLTRADSFIPYALPKNFLRGLLYPADQYYSKGGYFVPNKLVTMLSAAFSFIYVSLIPLLIVEWKRLSVPQKICIMAIILFRVVVYISIGTNKGIFDTMFSFVGMLVILLMLNVFHHTNEHIDKKTFVKISAFTVFLAVFCAVYFTSNISSRLGQGSIADNVKEYIKNKTATNEIEQNEAATNEIKQSETDEIANLISVDENEEVKMEKAEKAEEEREKSGAVAPKRASFLQRMYRYGTDYLTQGYYGMSLALDEEFTTTYGIGSSQFLMSNFKSLFGIDVKDRTYQHKITEQWHEDGKWHSFYSYVANDVSFYGVILVMFLIGLFYGCICKDVIENNSFIGKMLLPLFVILFMYMPANNQVFTAMATCTAFLELSALWIVSKIKLKKG